jgi:hypothetical protein
MIEITTQVTGITELRKAVGAYDADSKKALDTSIKVEGYRLLGVLRDQVRRGIPGGHPYSAVLSHIAMRTKSGRMRKNPFPLSRLAKLLRYNVDYSDGALSVSFGYISRGPNNLSESWKSLIRKHQAGVDVLYSGSRTELGIRMARIGGRLKKAGDPDARYFFLRRYAGRSRGFGVENLNIKIPSRPMIDPFWNEQRANALRNIRENFRRKMRGERI